MKIAILTSTIGQGTIQDPKYNDYSDLVDYIAYVDRDHKTQIWNQLPAPSFSAIDDYSNRRNAKLPKILGSLLSPEYDYYIWHDNHCEVVMSPTQIITDILGDSDFAVFKHPQRDCVYTEMVAIAEAGVESTENLIATHDFLRSHDYPEHAGLFELSSFVYRNTPTVQTAMLSWWELICRFSSRDQLTFPYILKKFELNHSIIPGAALPYGGNNAIIPSLRWKTT